MMKILSLILCAFLASLSLHSQNVPPITSTVKGVLLDSLTNQGEPYATIKFARKDAPMNAIKMAVTDVNGTFQEKIPGIGDFILTISSVGRKTVVKEFSLAADTKTFDVGTLYTADATEELKGVEVVAQKILVKVDIDKIEYNIEDDPDSKTNNILEMLRKVPMVTVDGEDQIRVNGSTSFKIHVNGKPNNMMSDNPKEVLKSMPASTIKYIEVITNPGAKYDAEGIGGILNIVTTGGGFEGYTATFSGNVSNTGAGGSLFGTIKKDKLTVTGRYGYNYDNRPKDYNSMVRENDATEDTGATTLTNNGENKSKGGFQHGTLEASYEIDTLRLITMSFGLYGGNNDGNGNSETWLKDAAGANPATQYTYNSFNNNSYSWYSIRGNIDYQRSFKVKGRLLTFSYNINSRPQTSDGTATYEYDRTLYQLPWLINQRSDGAQNTMENTFQADYTTPIGQFHTIETGLKYIIRNNISDNDYYAQTGQSTYLLDELRSSHYKNLNDIFAAYGSYSLRYKAFSLRAGLRYELTMLEVKYKNKPNQPDFSKDYGNLIPSASLGFKINDTQNLRGGYEMRIWRPGIYVLNPYLNTNDPTNVSQGNPDLDSERSHAFNLSYSSFTAKFNVNLSLNHSFNNNGIERISRLVDPSTIPGYDHPDVDERVLYSTYENIGKSRYSGMTAYVNWNATAKTRIYANMGGGYNTLNSPSQGLSNSGWNGYVFGGAQQTIPLKIRLSLNVYATSGYVSLQGKSDGMVDYSISAQRSFVKDRLTISAFAGNIFNQYMTYANSTTGQGFTQRSEYKYPNRRFGISVSYRIGELKASVKKAARSITNDDVKGGEGGSGGSGGGGGGN